ncbi:hypothetical protein [Brevibacillus formosus]|uniref:hypothetical protein n=1 Tax=Brevibacillus formosus TaxID=54913 RepID=UPI000A7A4E66|nr:hypothetical protein [Brevibacillus formosus]MED1957238.1 hypothetical protein [Brevibacillus formosus]
MSESGFIERAGSGKSALFSFYSVVTSMLTPEQLQELLAIALDDQEKYKQIAATLLPLSSQRV